VRTDTERRGSRPDDRPDARDEAASPGLWSSPAEARRIAIAPQSGLASA
jgi:hypothetical protein